MQSRPSENKLEVLEDKANEVETGDLKAVPSESLICHDSKIASSSNKEEKMFH